MGMQSELKSNAEPVNPLQSPCQKVSPPRKVHLSLHALNFEEHGFRHGKS